jgi:hypothetical protein
MGVNIQAIRYKAPKYPREDMGGVGQQDYEFEIKPESLRVATYAFFWSLVGFAVIITKFFVEPTLEAGAIDEPPERQGCGPFNRVSTSR